MKEKYQKILSSTASILIYHISHFLIFKFSRGHLLEQTDLWFFQMLWLALNFSPQQLNNSKPFWYLSILLSFVDGVLEQPSLQRARHTNTH